MKLLMLFCLLALSNGKKSKKKVKKTTLTIITGYADYVVTDTASGITDIYSNATVPTVVGTFAGGIFIVPNTTSYSLFGPTLYTFYFHPDGDISTSKDSIVAAGLLVVKNILTGEGPLLQLLPVIGGTGKYLNAKGKITQDGLTNPGFATFTAKLYF